MGNFDPALLIDTENFLNAFIVPRHAQPTGLAAADEAIAASTRVTSNGQDLNNFAPRAQDEN